MTTQICDRIEEMHGALVQHGPLNRRIYLMKLGAARPTELLPALAACAADNGYTKIFAKIPASAADAFIAQGYEREAAIPDYFGEGVDCSFMGKFIDPARAALPEAAELDRVLDLARSKAGGGISKTLPPRARIRACRPEDAAEMSAIYRVVFPSYPFPIDDPDYLRATMRTHIAYFGVELDGRLLALASSEMDLESGSVEMTDFATLPEQLGQGFAVLLLSRMEEEMGRRGLHSAYTIARAVSPGMNISFARLAYAYGGRLKNNTNISGRIESMNVWYKQLPRPSN
jgi:beta-lysine N6-acetyltransferase